MSKENQDLILMHLEEHLRENPDETWYTLLAYCDGYYGKIDLDIIWAVRCLQLEGKIK